ncbi:MAG: HAMP domain-containing histidine kinase [Planctomycetes bacterium]|nr:HAMP domain-containing histidine kinase [Planctomycetota bacterium]
MSIRSKITMLVLLVGLSEAVLLGTIGYNSVTSVSRNAAELRRIGSAIEGARALNVSLSRLSDPVSVLLRGDAGAKDKFTGDLGEIERHVTSCAATSCHGYEKRPPEMAGEVLKDLKGIREKGLEILSSRLPGSAPPLAAWAEGVDAPARKVTQMTGEMSETLMAKAREIEASSRSTDRSALLLVAITTLSCIVVAMALCNPIARGITRPLEKLAGQAGRIADGDLGIRAGESGPREIVLLARSFNRMLDDLCRHRDDLLEHQDRLERTVDERVGELRRKDEQLKRSERLAGIGLVAGTVAHELNNPLTNILLNAEVLLESAPAEGKGRRLVEDVMKDALRCREIAGNIRALGRETDIDMSPCVVDELAVEAIRLLRFKWEPRRISVRRDFHNGSAECLCSPPRILQLTLNLIDNAIDASPPGSEVRVGLRVEGRELALEVEDHGRGILSEDRVSLFKPFFTTKPDGTGLGLPICRRIAEQHEGRIECETRTVEETGDPGPAGHGTIVRVRLPLRREKGGAA